MTGALGAAALLLAVAGCGDGSGADQRSERRANVEAAVVERDTLRVTVRSVGSLAADQRVELAAETDGRVSEVAVQEGENVERGQLLLRLDRQKLASEQRAAEATLERARQQAANLRRQAERNEGLLAEGAISEQAYEDLQTRAETAEAEARQAEANLSLARARLADATVRAPFAGRVGIRRVDLGQYVRAGDPLVSLVDNDPLDIEFSVPERFLGQLQTGQIASVRVASTPDTTYEGRVTFVSPEVDVANRTVTVKATIPNASGALRAGQFADVILVLEVRPDALVVPEEAIVPRGGTNVVFAVEADTARRRNVQLGERSPGRVEIVAGLSAGDTVVVAGQQRLGDGTAVATRMRRPDGEVADQPAPAASQASSEDG